MISHFSVINKSTITSKRHVSACFTLNFFSGALLYKIQESRNDIL